MRLPRSALLVSFVAIACSSPSSSTESCDGGHVQSPLTGQAVLRDLAAFTPFANHLGRGGALRPIENGFAIVRAAPGDETWKIAGAHPLRAKLPARADGALVIDAPSASLTIRALDVHDVALEPIEGALAATDGDLGISFVAEADRVEEVRVVKTLERAARSRWQLATTATLRLRDGVVEALTADGRVAIASAPMFAVDARGVRRDLSLSLARVDAGTWSLEATLDTKGLTLPIAIDPSWSVVEAPLKARMKHTATLLTDGKVLVVGGTDTLGGSVPAVSTAEVFDPVANNWVATPALSEPRMGHTATKLADGKVLVIGGAPGTQADASSTAELYDPSANTWTKITAPLSEQRVGHVAILQSDGNVFVAGGVKNLLTINDPAYPYLVYQASTKTWTSTARPTGAPVLGVMPAVATISATRSLIIGGWAPGTNAIGRDVLLFDETATGKIAAKGTTKRIRQMAADYTPFSAAVTADATEVLVVGGGDDASEKINVATGVSIISGELFELWAGPSLTRLPSGEFLAVGGYVPGSATSLLPPAKMFPTAMVYRRASGTWVPTTPESTPRRWAHSATALPDGRVLVVGGRNKDEVVRSAELYSPLKLGDKCTQGGDCASGNCVDGVCCDRICGDQCEACNSSGKCQPVKGSPRGLRPLCDNPGAEICRAMLCDGTKTDACVLPGADVKCADAICNNSMFTPDGACDGAGLCKKSSDTACAPYGCSEDGCRTTCAAITDCANGAICVSGVCIAAAGGACSADLTRSIGTDGKETACQPFKCIQASGKCADTCTSSTECAGGFVCGSGTCQQPAIAPAEDGGGCSTTHSRTSGGAFAALLLALSLLRKRR